MEQIKTTTKKNKIIKLLWLIIKMQKAHGTKQNKRKINQTTPAQNRKAKTHGNIKQTKKEICSNYSGSESNFRIKAKQKHIGNTNKKQHTYFQTSLARGPWPD